MEALIIYLIIIIGIGFIIIKKLIDRINELVVKYNQKNTSFKMCIRVIKDSDPGLAEFMEKEYGDER